MTISNFRATEPLYIIILRDENAESMLRSWAKKSSAQVNIEKNRMRIYEERSLTLFYLNWQGDWELVTIWDCWNKRHIYKT